MNTVNKKFIPKQYILSSVFLLSSIAMIGSLIYSNAIGFPPCDLCWYQRIFMYPIVFISGYAFFKKDKSVIPYLKLLTYIGGFIALFHNFIYYTNINPLPCSATASCTARYVYEFGFMTIPLMSLSIFVLILIILSQKEKSLV
jgi:disulfide bond formation protein DsbB